MPSGGGLSREKGRRNPPSSPDFQAAAGCRGKPDARDRRTRLARTPRRTPHLRADLPPSSCRQHHPAAGRPPLRQPFRARRHRAVADLPLADSDRRLHVGVDPAVLLHHVSGDASARRFFAFFHGPGRMLRVNGPAFVAEVAGATGRFASVLAAVGANVPPKDLSPGSLHCRIVWLRPGYPDLSEPARGHGDARRPAPAAWGDPPAASFVRITELSRDRRRIVIILGES